MMKTVRYEFIQHALELNDVLIAAALLVVGIMEELEEADIDRSKIRIEIRY